MPKKIDLKSFVERANLVHSNYYDYSLVKFETGLDKIEIICKKHGIFKQRLKSHLAGSGCKECFLDKRRINNEDFIKKANLIHNYKYDYSKIEKVKNNAQNITIICPIHGDFKQTMNSHLVGQNCPECGKISSIANRTFLEKDWLEKVKEKHDNKYSYDNMNYQGCDVKVQVKCPEHGDFFIRAGQHMFGKGCPKCGRKKSDIYKKRHIDNFFDKAPKIHNNFYSYEKVQYENAHKHLIITCPIHGDFKMNSNTHLNGSGCRQCFNDRNGYSKTSFIKACKNNISRFYVIECWNEEERFIKIGITSKTVNKRYRPKDMPYKFSILTEIIDIPDVIWNLEKEGLRKFVRNRYKPILSFRGYTECFDINIKDDIIYEFTRNAKSK